MRFPPLRLSGFWALVLTLTGIVDSAFAQFANLSRGPYVQMATPDSMVVAWRCDSATLPVVRFGTSPDEMDRFVFPGLILVRLSPEIDAPPGALRLHSSPEGTHQYEAYIGGLSADTEYYYAVYDGDRLLAGGGELHRFRTSPSAGAQRSLRLWVLGDSGRKTVVQQQVFNAALAFENSDGKAIDAFLHLGDMAYSVGSDADFSFGFFESFAPLLRRTVCWPTMGNHEGVTSRGTTGVGPYYDAYVVPTDAEAGGVGSGTEAYYSFDIGPVHFISLDSHDLDRSPGGAMALWLQADLAATAADWIIAFWHHPPYSKGSHDSDTELQLVEMRSMIMPILESGGVDLVLGGHSHVYERSFLIDGAYATPSVATGVILNDGDGDPAGDGAYFKSAGLGLNGGTVAVVAGHALSAFRRGLHPLMRRSELIQGSLFLDIDGGQLVGTMVDRLGGVRDRFVVVKAGAVENSPIEHPWRPFGPEILDEIIAPGMRRLTLVAQPPAPDAVVRYTLDGSEITDGAAVYTQPIEITSGAEVVALSSWSGGQRVSPVSSALFPHPGDATRLKLRVRHGHDDGFFPEDGAVAELDGTALDLGSSGAACWRFEDVRLPKDVIVLGAYLQCESAVTNYGAATLKTAVEMVGAAAPLSVGDLNARAWSADVDAAVSSSFAGNAGVYERSGNLAAEVEAVTRRADWSPGNAMAFKMTSDASRAMATVESGLANAATLTIEYIASADLQQRLASSRFEFLTSPSLVRPGGTVTVRFERPQDHARIGLSYVIEGSETLSEGSWQELQLDNQSVFQRSDGAWEDVRGQLLLPQAGLAFIRVSIRQDEPGNP